MNKKELTFKKAQPPAIERITVAGYKSISREQSIEIRPLTILAGANSSGKSSILQPLLLLKQTLESPYNPGAILIDGANVKFTSADQLFSRNARGKRGSSFSVGIEDSLGNSITVLFAKPPKGTLSIARMHYSDGLSEGDLRPDMPASEIDKIVAKFIHANDSLLDEIKSSFVIEPVRCFLEVMLKKNRSRNGGKVQDSVAQVIWDDLSRGGGHRLSPLFPGRYFTPYITQVVHLPGLRGNPERDYPVTGVDSSFPGTFENYTASVIAHWQEQSKIGNLESLSEDLMRLGLTWKVLATPVTDTRVELRVGRLPKQPVSSESDLVSLADVGLGVSQTLPVLVALRAASSGQLVYLEQPEIHLHPRAQTALAFALAEAAKRGVQVVAETHSSLLLLGIQTLVAEGKLPPELVKLHWFTRSDDGVTTVRSADLDEAGAFGDWPTDFDEVELTTQSRYIDAAAARQQVH